MPKSKIPVKAKTTSRSSRLATPASLVKATTPLTPPPTPGTSKSKLVDLPSPTRKSMKPCPRFPTPPAKPTRRTRLVKKTSPKKSPPQPTFQIDHLSFPHIIDLIIARSGRASLLVLRSTSRHLTHLADKALARHLTLDGNGIRHAEGRHPALKSSDKMLTHCHMLDIRSGIFLTVSKLLKPSFVRLYDRYWPVGLSVPDTLYVEARNAPIGRLEGLKKVVAHQNALGLELRFPESLEELVLLNESGLADDTVVKVIAKHAANYAEDNVTDVRISVISPMGAGVGLVDVREERAKLEKEFRARVENNVLKGSDPDPEISAKWTSTMTWTREGAKVVADDVEITTFEDLGEQWWQ